MRGKIVDFIEMNRDLNGQTLPIEKNKIMECLGNIPRDIAKEYSDV